MKVKNLRIIGFTIGCWGLVLIGCGITMNTKETTIIENKYSLTVSQTKVSESKTNEIKLKDMKIEINNPLSVDVKDYLEKVENIDESVIKALKLDTSAVNTQEAGTYTYTISYKKKKYNGTFIVTEKELPKVNLTLNELKLEVGAVLDTNLGTYIKEKLDDEVQKNIVLDLSKVDTKTVGTYQYTVTYNGKLYTSKIVIYSPQKGPIVITPNNSTETKDNTDNKETTNEKSDTAEESKQEEKTEEENNESDTE